MFHCRPLLTTMALCLCVFAEGIMSPTICRAQSAVADSVLAPIAALDLTPDGSFLAAAGTDGIQVIRWRDRTPHPAPVIDAPTLCAVAFSPDGRQLAIAGGVPGESGIVAVCSWPQSEVSWQHPIGSDCIQALTWLGTEAIAAAGMDGDGCLLNAEDGSELARYRGHTRGLTCVAVTGGSAPLIVTGSIDQTLRVHEPSGQNPPRVLNNHTDIVLSCAPSPEHLSGLPLVASSSDDRTLRFWQPSIGRLVRFTRLPVAADTLAWTNTGHHILAGCRDGAVRSVDVRSAQVTGELTQLDELPHRAAAAERSRRVLCLRVHPTEGCAVSGGADGRIRIWGIPPDHENK